MVDGKGSGETLLIGVWLTFRLSENRKVGMLTMCLCEMCQGQGKLSGDKTLKAIIAAFPCRERPWWL